MGRIWLCEGHAGGAKGVNKGGGQDHVLRSVRRWKGSEDTRSRGMKDTGKVQRVE